MTRLKLSNMLLTYIGMAVDILGFLQTGLGIGRVACSKNESLAVAFLVTLSLFPLTFDLDLYLSGIRHEEETKDDRNTCKLWWNKCPTEVKTILLLVCCQDIPFVIYRIYLASKFHHDSDDFHALIFFIIKNFMVLMLQGYRLWVLSRNSKKDEFEKDREDKKQGDQKDIEMS